MSLIRPVLLAGGKGARLQPLSRPERPKQFLSLLEDDSPFQDTMERVSDPALFLPPLIVTTEGLVDVVIDQCDEIAFDDYELLIEAEGRNTAPVFAAVALWAQERGENDPLLFCPCDHFMSDVAAFARAVHDAAHTARQGYFVAFGVVADRAETAYGYIEVGPRLDAGYSGHHVERFVEKPSLEKAEDLLQQGRIVWNAGIYCATPDHLLQEFQSHCPEVLESVTAAFDQRVKGLIDYQDCVSLSVDVAISQKSKRLAVVSLLTSWSDLGTWPGLWRALALA